MFPRERWRERGTGFNKALALDFPLTIPTTTPLDTWCCPCSTKCQGSLQLEKASPWTLWGPPFMEYPPNFSYFCQINVKIRNNKDKSSKMIWKFHINGRKIFSPTRPSGSSWSSSRKVCLSVCLISPFHVIFLTPLIGPQVTWSDPDLSLVPPSISISISISSRAKTGMCSRMNQVSIFAWTESVFWCGSVVSSRALYNNFQLYSALFSTNLNILHFLALLHKFQHYSSLFCTIQHYSIPFSLFCIS